MNITALAKQLGRKGGVARSKKLSPEEKKRIASYAAQTRWLSEKAFGRLLGNLRYLRAVEILRKIPRVKSVSRVTTPLPRFYG